MTMTTEHYTAVFTHESNGTVSGWIAGFPGVYASANSIADAKIVLREALDAHLATLRELNELAARSEVHVLRYSGKGLDYVGLGALLGKRTSRARGHGSFRLAAARRLHMPRFFAAKSQFTSLSRNVAT